MLSASLVLATGAAYAGGRHCTVGCRWAEAAGNSEYNTTRWLLHVMTALVNDMSAIISVHDELGQSGAPGIGVVGEFVLTLNGVFPFLTSLPGIDTLPVTVTGAGFCPGA